MRLLKNLYSLIFDFFFAAFVVLGGIVFILLVITLIDNNYLKFLYYNERYDYKVFYSPSKKYSLTLLLHTKGVYDSYTYPYVIQGEYKIEKIPLDQKNIEYYHDSGVFIEWDGDGRVNIYGAGQISNTFDLNPEGYVVNVIDIRNCGDLLKKKDIRLVHGFSDMTWWGAILGL